MQVPVVTSVTVVPEAIVQTAGVCVLKLTVKPELDVATIDTGEALIATFAGCVKLIVCVPCVIVTVLTTGVAA